MEQQVLCKTTHLFAGRDSKVLAARTEFDVVHRTFEVEPVKQSLPLEVNQQCPA